MSLRPTLALTALILLGLACRPPTAPTSSGAAEPPPAPASAATEDRHGATVGVDDPRLAAILLEHWEALMREYPTWATRQGDSRYDDRLAFYGADERRRREGTFDALAARAETLDPSSLSPGDALTLRLFVDDLAQERARRVCRFPEWSISVRGNPLADANDLVEIHPRDDGEDFRTLLARYQLVERTLDDDITNLRVGMSDGLVANAESVRRVLELVDRWLAAPLDDNVLLTPLEDLPPGGAEGDRERVVAEFRQVVEGSIVPAVERYATFLRHELLPAARPGDATGLSHLPVGEACYGALVRGFTTLPRSADELHATGLEQLSGIHAEFRTIGLRLWGTDDLATIFERLRTDPELYFSTSEEVQAKAESALASAREAMPRAFGRVPRARCTVDAIPELEAPYTTIAYYRRPAPDGSRPGTYFVNTYAPETRPRHEAEVLAFHESIPGHHLQIAIAQELGELPAFRRNTGATAFVEGWALYTERLADELGLYSGDLDRLGMLSFDAWRAARLVVDTGLHHQGRSREWAIGFLTEMTPLAPNNIDNEVDRYISRPGQALAYKTGQLEILAMRRRAEQALGDRFDLRAFHDALLGGGALPLPLLEERIDAWIASAAAEPDGQPQ